ncbi:hypothetical protein CC1G_07704 [Coprinopsis cinerea okayama7|uniref:GDP-fucose protein O-fucosyltransferase 2 n=1 Tax=Coprinopsis cinerea (strain Okayama-7 / 130 / ATCC MYA-4618 / FGSC 9003) TaxID=240176 RepID=A8NBV7_COPC7|nr:hypothetical protein CC1G_07704 [Coprinopsis cinerea okayama7\|eukprot:XP_001832317.2 hypothetical protein CC1G_07704 [Coprinopsis cinerea okayama7\
MPPGVWTSVPTSDPEENFIGQHRRNDSESLRRSGARWWTSKRFLLKVTVGTVCFLALLRVLTRDSGSQSLGPVDESALSGNTTQAQEEKSAWDSSFVLNGAPTMKFRDNLLPNKKYITTFLSAGWTNDVMTYINLIYLAILTERIPIIATFIPSHIGEEVPPIPFSDVFDIPRLRKELKMPIVEWNEVKANTSQEFDEVGCWNTWEAAAPWEGKPRFSRQPEMLGLDISYTKAPSWIKLVPQERELFLSFWALAALAFPDMKKEYAVEPAESPRFHLKLPPDDQLLCYDYLYFVSAHLPFEYDYDFSPAWRFVGQHLHWTPHVDGLADQYVRRTLGIADGEKTPTWIAVHLRHGDFARICENDHKTPLSECFAPLPVVARRVDEVKEELLQRKGISVEHVIMLSDETDPEWWEDVKKLGWYSVDHSETVQLYGPWYPVLIDAAIQSGGMGFVGTTGSTMSVLARRRVESWRDGATRMVRWGRPGADDH